MAYSPAAIRWSVFIDEALTLSSDRTTLIRAISFPRHNCILRI
jgi:hypothetical protein